MSFVHYFEFTTTNPYATCAVQALLEEIGAHSDGHMPSPHMLLAGAKILVEKRAPDLGRDIGVVYPCVPSIGMQLDDGSGHGGGHSASIGGGKSTLFVDDRVGRADTTSMMTAHPFHGPLLSKPASAPASAPAPATVSQDEARAATSDFCREMHAKIDARIQHLEALLASALAQTSSAPRAAVEDA